MARYRGAVRVHGANNVRMQPDGKVVYKSSDEVWINKDDGTWVVRKKK